MQRDAMGKEGLLAAALVSLVLYFLAYFAATPPAIDTDFGICFPSVNLWGFSPFWGWLVNMLTLWGVCVMLYFLNKEYSIVGGSDTVLTAMAAIMLSSNVWLSGILSTTALMALANLICLWILFGCYKKRNATQEIFLIATILSLGSTIQYGFIFMLPVYLIGAIMMKCFNFKVLAAFMMGIVAPYWVGIGLGIITLESFRIPEFGNIATPVLTKSGIFVGNVNILITITLGFLIGLINMVKLYAGNTHKRINNTVVDILGLVTAACTLIDSENSLVYLATLYVVAAVQLGNLFALRSIPKGGWWLAALSALYVAGFGMMAVTLK